MMISAEISWVTKSMAQEWLDTQVHNRLLGMARVQHICGIIDRDEWQLTSDAIAFDTDGHLMNGQHRLRAICLRDAKLPLLVVRGLDSRAFMVLDTGQRRTAGQALQLSGVVNAANVAATARLVMTYDNKQMQSSPIFTHDQIMQFTTQNAESLHRWVALGKNVNHYLKVSTTAIATLGVIAARSHDSSDVQQYIEGVKTGVDLQEGDPRLAARNWLTNENAKATGGRKAPAELAILITAFNHWVLGRSVRNVRGWRHGETYPEIITGGYS